MEYQPPQREEKRAPAPIPSLDGSPATESEPKLTPRIYVADLAAYNQGLLHGSWLEADQSPEELHEQITAMLATAPLHGGEEWAIHDSEGFNGLHLGEWENLEYVSRIARGITEHGLAYAHWAQMVDSDEELDRFEECYFGTWDSVKAYAEAVFEDLGLYEQVERAVSDNLKPYVRLDAAGFGRDLVLGGDITTAEAEGGGVYVFDNR